VLNFISDMYDSATLIDSEFHSKQLYVKGLAVIQKPHVDKLSTKVLIRVNVKVTALNNS
jgi:hypothetical protein